MKSKNSISTFNLDFGFRLFQKLCQNEKEKNLFFSPLSIQIALMMLYEGASGKTREVLGKTLGLSEQSSLDLSQFTQTLLQSLSQPENEIEIAIANSLWLQQNYPIQERFSQKLRDFYQAQVKEIDFQNPNAVSLINRWVEENTKGSIKKILDRVTPDQIFTLINAIYFQATWQNQFEKKDTIFGTFVLSDQRTKLCPFMTKLSTYECLSNETFQAVCLPYQEGRFRFYAFLPEKQKNISHIYQELNTTSWNRFMQSFAPRKLYLALPRFRAEFETRLEQILSSLGMKIAFDPELATFDRIAQSPPNLFVSEIRHKALVDIDEEGTKAAAVTAISTRAGGALQYQSLVLQRPFVYTIVDSKTKTILFMGLLQEPNEGSFFTKNNPPEAIKKWTMFKQFAFRNESIE